MTAFIEFVPEASEFPQFYGLIRRDYLRYGCLACPMPFNWLFRWWGMFFEWIRFPRHESVTERVERLTRQGEREYLRGYEKGLHEGRDRALAEYDAVLQKVFNASRGNI